MILPFLAVLSAPAMLIVPDDVQGKYPTLREGMSADNWPMLDKALGYQVRAVARCNPVRRPVGCVDAKLERAK